MNKALNNNLSFNLDLQDSQRDMFNFIFSLIPHKQDAEDILQKTNLILCQKQDQFDPKKASFKTWAFKIARYQVLAHKTIHSRSKICFSNELTETLADQAVDHKASFIKQEALKKCYKKLPEHMREIAELRFKRELSMKEISASIKRPIGSVSATLTRIRSNIMGCIKDAYIEAEKEFYT